MRTRGELIKKSEYFADVTYGVSLRMAAANVIRMQIDSTVILSFGCRPLLLLHLVAHVVRFGAVAALPEPPLALAAFAAAIAAERVLDDEVAGAEGSHRHEGAAAEGHVHAHLRLVWVWDHISGSVGVICVTVARGSW